MSTEFTLDDIFGDSLDLLINGNEEQEEIKEQEEQKLIKVVDGGITILDKDLLNKINKTNLSASVVDSLFECTADWVLNRFLLELMDYEEPNYFTRGNMFHGAMELFFALPKEQRSPKTLSQVAMETVKKDFKEQLNKPEEMHWLKDALKGYLQGGFPYKEVNVAQITLDEKRGPQSGIEIFVGGKLGNTTRRIVGFVDRVDQLADGSLGIVDYKSGKKVYPFRPDKPIGDRNSFSQWRQQLAYTILLEQAGHNIGGAKLEFPVARETVVVDVNNQAMREQTIKDFEKADLILNKCIEDNFFPFNGHMFCKWCGILSPNHAPSRYGKLNVTWADIHKYIEVQEKV